MGIIRNPHERLNKNNKIVESQQTIVENALLGAVFVGSAVIPMLHLIFGIVRFANYQPSTWVVLAGSVLLIFGVWLFWRSHRDLGRNWSVSLEIREGHEIVNTGVYKRIRHPMYSAIFLVFLAQALLINNWIAGFGGIAAFLLMYIIRVPREEAMMRESFGEEYDDYCWTTGRILPKLFR